MLDVGYWIGVRAAVRYLFLLCSHLKIPTYNHPLKKIKEIKENLLYNYIFTTISLYLVYFFFLCSFNFSACHVYNLLKIQKHLTKIALRHLLFFLFLTSGWVSENSYVNFFNNILFSLFFFFFWSLISSRYSFFLFSSLLLFLLFEEYSNKNEHVQVARRICN